MKKKIALLSVYNKTGILEFARFLIAYGYSLYASGGTAKALTQGNIENTDISELVGGGAILGHKVVSLSREVHAGLLADPTIDTEIEELESLGIPFIDLVCVDLYPLKETINGLDATEAAVITKTDIGGPTMLSSAAKSRRIVVGDYADRQKVKEWIQAGEPDREHFLRMLAAKADFIVASYRLLTATYHSNGAYAGVIGELHQTLKYGENAWQTPAYWLKEDTTDPLALHEFIIHAGNPGYVNITDVDRALHTVTHIAAAFEKNLSLQPIKIGVAVKHGNACGAAWSDTSEEVLKKVIDGNRKSIFGGAILVNFPITVDEAEFLIHYGMEEGKRRPIDVVVASFITEDAIEKLRRKNDRCLLMSCPHLNDVGVWSVDTSQLFRKVRGGVLVQPNYNHIFDFKDAGLVRYGSVERTELQRTTVEDDTLLGWALCATQDSNTIVLIKNGMLIGAGVKQKDRVEAAELAIKIAEEAGHTIQGAVAVSDSFFPFPDAPQTLIDAGVTRILATSGSQNDKATIALFENSETSELLLIPDKTARMFFGH